MIKIKIALPIILVAVYTVLILLGSDFFEHQNRLIVTQNTYVNFQVGYQLLLLMVTGVSLTTTYLLNRENFNVHFSLGRISAPAQQMKLFGIKEGDTWLNTGVSLVVVISVATGTFMFFQLNQSSVDLSYLSDNITWIVLFSLTNSFGEEMIYRVGLVSPLRGQLEPTRIFIISAILFGLPHFAGMPSGPIGVMMAGILGFVLSKSVFETKGIFWAWTIHLIQDIIIIGAAFLQENTKT